MNRLLKLALLILIAVSSGEICVAQKFAAKTNLLDDALLNVNIGAEIGVAPKWTIDVPVSLNFWRLSHERRWKHWAVQPGARYWFCNTFAGHFVGMHLHGGQYNIGGLHNDIKFLGTDFGKLRDSRYEGWFVGAGVSYGYSWILGKHWNLEAELGIGWSYTRSDRYPCTHCGTKLESNKVHNYVGPTKAALNIVYVF